MTKLQLGAREIHFRLTGAQGAPVLALAHPLGGDLSVWDAVSEILAPRFRLLAFDARGHGGSWKPPGPFTLDDLGGDFLALLDALALPKAHFCGLSMGGLLGQWLLVRAPERLEKLVLANTAAHLPDAAAWNGRIDTVSRQGMAGLAPAILPRWLSESFRAAQPDSAARIDKLLRGCDPKGYAGCCAALRDADFRAALSGAAKMDILVIVGEADGSTPPAMAEELARLAGARLARLEAAHLSCFEDAPGFARLLLDFL